jgi:septum formation inhibitor-activating ATPase MinD
MMPGAADDEGVTPQKIARIVEAAKQSFDLIIVDCPSAGTSGAAAFANRADLNIICTTTDMFHLNSAAYLRRYLPESDDKCRLVLTRLSPDLIKDDICQNIDIAIDAVGARLIGIQPEERAVLIGSGGKGLPKATLCAREAKNIIDRIYGRDIPLIKL